MAACSEPIGLFGLRAEISIIEARRLECRVKISRLQAFFRLARRASQDDLLNQFTACDGRGVTRGVDQSLLQCQPLFFAESLPFIGVRLGRISFRLITRQSRLARSFLREVEGSFKRLAEASGEDLL